RSSLLSSIHYPPRLLPSFPTRRSSDLREKQVTLTSDVYSSYPEHTTDIRQPSLLWPALYFTDSLVRCAVQRGITSLLSLEVPLADRKSTRLNSSHGSISYAVFCLKKKQ